MANNLANEDSGFAAAAGQILAMGDAVALGADGLVYLANAAVSTPLQVPCVGFAETAVAVGEWVQIKRSGKMTYGTAGLTIGGGAAASQIFLGETDGAITQTAPSTSGDYVQQVGVAITADQWMIQLGKATIV